MRVWLQRENGPGLAMSRSLGDRVGSQCGVSSEPEVSDTLLSAEDKMLIIASDGLWEFISSKEAIELVAPYWTHKDVEGACDRLVTEALTRWQTHDTAIDDITCIVVFINTEIDASTLL